MPEPVDTTRILVLGGGPAGAATAIGLSRLGFDVRLLDEDRERFFLEGLSPRVVEALRHLRCERALQAVGPWVERTSFWNGAEAAANGEFLVERDRLNAALRADAAAAGVEVITAGVQAVAHDGHAWQVLCRTAKAATARLAGRFLIEARGRRAPAGGRRRHGPATTALVRRWRLGSAQTSRTAVEAFRDGWAWLALPGDGTASLQISVAGGRLPRRQALEDFHRSHVAALRRLHGMLEGAEPIARLVARNANAVLAPACAGESYLRVGDAAVAVDPLSGHGIFQALAGALAAPAVINTLVRRPEASGLARSFYEERMNDAFLRFARVGRDFYRLEQRWTAQPFWHDRAAWPDDLPAHPATADGPVRIATRPVIENDFVVEREVVITPDHARGIWQLEGVMLAPVVRDLAHSSLPDGPALWARIARLTGAGDRQCRTVAGWLTRRGLTAPTRG